jgi:hypothetical protein
VREPGVVTRVKSRTSWLGTAAPTGNGHAEAERSIPAARRVWVDVAALVGLVLLLGFLWGRGRHVWFWLDEGISVGISSHPLSRIPTLLRQDGSPPLYYLLLHVWMAVFGTSDEATHVLSLVFALAAVPVGFWAGSSLFGRRAGWITAVLVAINPFIADYANETRMYTLVALLGLVCTAAFLHAFVFRRRKYLPVFAASLAILLYTHNWALFFTLGAGVALLASIALAEPDQRRGLFLDGVLTFGAAGLAYLPWLPTLAYQVAHTGAPFTLRPTLEQVREDLMDLLGGPEGVIILGLGSGVAFMALFRRPWSTVARSVLLAGVVVAVTVVAGWGLSRHNAVWVYRYLAVVVGPLVLVVAAGLAEGGRTALAALGLAVLFLAPVAVKGQAYEKSNVKDVVDKLGGSLGRGDLVVTDFGRVPVLRHYIGPGPTYAETTGPVADSQVSDQRDATRRLDEGHPETTIRPSLEALATGGHVLVVCSAGELPLDATPFLRLIFERCDQALALASQNPGFRLDGTVTAPPYGSNSPVNGYLFTKIS